MEIKNISYAAIDELIDEVSDENVKRRKELEIEIHQLDKSKFIEAKDTIFWTLAFEESIVNDVIKKLRALKTDINNYRKILVNQIKDREQEMEDEDARKV